MKKTFITFVGLLLFITSFPFDVNATADNQEIDPGMRVEGMETDDGTMWWQYAYWDTTAEFPEYIGYIEYNDDTAQFEVGLVDNTLDNQQELLEMVPNSQDEIVFEDATFSREEQKIFREEFTEEYMYPDISPYDIRGISWDKDAIAIYAPAEHVPEYKEYFENTYPNRVVVHPEENFSYGPVNWEEYYLSKLPPEPDYGTKEYIIHHFGEDNGTIEWHYQYWTMMEHYPENVGFIRVHSNQTTWEVGLVENTSETRAEFLSLVPNSVEYITFFDAAYSINELTRVQNEIIQEYFNEEEHPFYALGIIDDRIYLSVDEAYFEETRSLFSNQYGDMVVVEIGLPAELDEETVLYGEDPNAAFGTSWRTVLLIGGMALVATFVFWQRNQQIAKKQTNTGHTIDETQSLSDAEIEQLIKETDYEPRDEVYQAILKQMTTDKQG